MNPTPATLLPRVEEILARITEASERERIDRFFRAAAAALDHLNQLERTLQQLEMKMGGRRFWPVMQPHFHAALEDVHRFLELTRAEFPVGEGDGELNFDAAFSEAPEASSGSGEDPTADVAGLLSSIGDNLSRDITRVQSTLENFAKAEDRWNLLDTLGMFMGKSRFGIGEMVFSMSRLHAMVRKQDVVPFYVLEIANSVALRHALGDFRLGCFPHRNLLMEPEVWEDESAAKFALDDLTHEIDAFMADDAYGMMRPTDQRAFFEVRRDLALLGKKSPMSSEDIQTTLEGFSRFLDSLLLINRREVLQNHDHDAVAGIVKAAVALAQTAGAGWDAGAALEVLKERAELLFGRDPDFDRLVASLRSVEGDGLDPALATRLSERATRILEGM